MIGVVVIGRNEGARLAGSLQSVLAAGVEPARIAYVDSGSTDGSVQVAKRLGVHAIELDASEPFTAARGRNAGFAKLAGEVQFVQFIDGDCEVSPDWLSIAEQALATHPKVAAVGGRCRERFPDASVFNRLCDIEWNTPIGEARELGGNAMMRVEAFQAAGGFDTKIIAGEDTELCLRLTEAGWKILRLDAEMVLHDAAITRLRQWWRRMVRAGHAFAETSDLHGMSSSRHKVKEVRSNWVWGLACPLAAVATAWPTRGISIALAGLVYLALGLKIRRSSINHGLSPSDATLFARYAVLAKSAMALGQLKYVSNRLLGRRAKIIEYKGRSTPLASGAQ